MITQTSRSKRCRRLGWAAGCALLIIPLAGEAQISMRPASRPLVSAENERWYQEGEPITFSGSFYYPAGAEVFFNPYEMIRSGEYRGIPLYSMKTREPYAIVYAPVGRGLMQPYERRREGDLAGTVGTTTPSFPVALDNEAWPPDAGAQAQGPPALSEFPGIPGSAAGTDLSTTTAPSIAGTSGATPAPSSPRGPLTTALAPKGLNAFYVEYKGRRWFSDGPTVLLDPSSFTSDGDYHGFPVYIARAGRADTIYIAVSSSAGGLLTPYSPRK